MLEKFLIFFVFFIPFQFALHPAEGIDLALIRVFAIGAIFFWVARGLAKKRFILPSSLPLFLFSALLVCIAMSFLWAENMGWALRKIVFLFSLAPLFLVFYSSFRSREVQEKVFQSLVMGSAAVALFSLLQFLAQFIFGVEKVFAFWVGEVLPFFLGPAFGEAVANYPSLLVNISGATIMRASGFFPDPHMAAFFFGMTFPLAFSCAWGSAVSQRKFWIICTTLIFFADLFTFSRGGYVGLVAGAVALSFSLLFWYRIKKKQIIKFCLGIAAVLCIVFLSPVGTRLASSFSYTDGSNIERIRLWKESLSLIEKHPVLGVGLGNYPLLVKPTATYREPIYAHNLFLDIALETGILGLFFFVALLIFGIVSAWVKWYQEKSPFFLAIFISLIIFSAHSFFETALFSVHILPLLLLLLAASMISTNKEEE